MSSIGEDKESEIYLLIYFANLDYIFKPNCFLSLLCD